MKPSSCDFTSEPTKTHTIKIEWTNWDDGCGSSIDITTIESSYEECLEIARDFNEVLNNHDLDNKKNRTITIK